jgi:hypothetical protein
MIEQQIQSAILKLETLQKEFSLTMNQYKKAFASYTNSINNPITKTRQLYLEQIKELNTKLTKLNSQIMNVSNDVNPSYQSSVNQIVTGENNLNYVYISLKEEKDKIDKLLAEYNTLDNVQMDSALKVESNYAYYRIFLIIVIILIFLLIKQMLSYSLYSSSSGMRGGGIKISLYDMLFNFILIILFLFLAHAFKHSAG